VAADGEAFHGPGDLAIAWNRNNFLISEASANEIESPAALPQNEAGFSLELVPCHLDPRS
jgi:hypothetical protein